MYYDLHIHSALSPCAENEMTPNNICNMAIIKGLELIAVTDHNSVKQLPAFSVCAERLGIKALYGAELQTAEEVHILGLFKNVDDALKLQPWIDEHMPSIPNKTDFFGDEWICNEEDEFIEQEERLLLVSLTATLEETIDKIHALGGRAILAHVLDRENSVTNQLGFIPDGLKYDGLEIKSLEEIPRVLKNNPWIKEEETNWFIDSDAHRLIDMAEPEHYMTSSTFNRLWGDEA